MKCFAVSSPLALAILAASLGACGRDEPVRVPSAPTNTGGTRTKNPGARPTLGDQTADPDRKANSGGAATTSVVPSTGRVNTDNGAPAGGNRASTGSGKAATAGAAQVHSLGANGSGTTPATATTGGQAGVANTNPTSGIAGQGNRTASTGNAGSGDTIGANERAFSVCTKTLKAKCAYDKPESACSSLMTPAIPLTDGTIWGNTELLQGPYGSYVEWNEGAGFANSESLLESTCAVAASSFGEPQSVTQDVLDLRGQDLKLYTVFRPACMKDGEKYPVITWGNGTCGQSGSYGAFLATVSSYGFVVVAANSRWTDQGNKEMLRALDLAKKANEDPASVFYQRLDLSKVGAMGHSQGGSATARHTRPPTVASRP